MCDLKLKHISDKNNNNFITDIYEIDTFYFYIMISLAFTIFLSVFLIGLNEDSF